MDKFQESENEGRRIFESLLKQSRTAKNWNPTNDRYNFVDGFFELKDKKIVVEIKTRDRRYADYPSHLMQIDKYMNLTKAKIDNSCSNGIYVNIFGSDLIYLYDLKYINASNCIQVKDGRSFMKYQSDMHRYLRKMVISGNK